MRVTRHRDAPYWPHSAPDDDDDAPEVVDLDAYSALARKACPGQCNKAWRRANPLAMSELRLAYITRDERIPYRADVDVVNGAVASLVAVASGKWCSDCDEEIRAAVGRLDYVMNDVARLALDGGQLMPAPLSEIHAMAVDVPSPSPAFDLLDLLTRWPEKWLRKLSVEVGGIDGLAEAGASYQSMLGHWAQLMEASFAVAFGRDALATLKRSEMAAGIDDAVEHLVDSYCPRCDRSMLIRRNGSEQVECEYCHHKLTRADYQRLSVSNRVTTEGKTA